YFSAISAAIDIGIVIYNTWWFNTSAPCPSLTAALVRRLAEAEQVIAVKWSVPPQQDYDTMREFAGLVNVIDNDNQPLRCHKNGGRGYINNTMCACPAHDLALWDLMEARRYDEAQVLWDRVNAPLSTFSDKAAQRSGGYRVNKGLMAMIGRPMGAPRPPT